MPRSLFSRSPTDARLWKVHYRKCCRLLTNAQKGGFALALPLKIEATEAPMRLIGLYEIEGLKKSHTREAIRKRLELKPKGSFLRDFIYGAIDGTVTLLPLSQELSEPHFLLPWSSF